MSGRLRMVLLPAGLVAGLLAEWPTWLARPDWGTVVDLGVGWAFLAAGFMAWSRRPANRVGPLLTAIGFSWFLYNLIFTRNPVAFGIGFWLGSLFIALLVHLVLAFPSGHLVLMRLSSASHYSSPLPSTLPTIQTAGPARASSWSHPVLPMPSCSTTASAHTNC